MYIYVYIYIYIHTYFVDLIERHGARTCALRTCAFDGGHEIQVGGQI